MQALFITVEGLDGSGKSFHLGRVAELLTRGGIAHCVTHEPGGTPLGEGIRSLFLDPEWGQLDGVVELLMVFASRRDHLERVIEPALRAGKHVLCDRFTDSTLAYQGYGRGVSLPSIAEIDRIATGGRVPDRTLLFDLPAPEARRRGHAPARQRRSLEDGGIDRLDREEIGFYRRVREGYLALAEASPQRFRVIDSNRDKEQTAVDVLAALADLPGIGLAAERAEPLREPGSKGTTARSRAAR